MSLLKEVERYIKRVGKRKIKVCESLMVAFMITGCLGFSETILAEENMKQEVTMSEEETSEEEEKKENKENKETVEVYFHVNTGEADQAKGNAETNLGPIGSIGGATGARSIAAGIGTTSTGKDSVAYGLYASAIGERSLALGGGIDVSGNDSIGIGNVIEVYGEGNTAIGSGILFFGEESKNNIVVGRALRVGGSEKAVSDAVILGNEGKVSIDGGIALGKKSISDREVIQNKDSPETESLAGALSLGGVDSEGKHILRQITNVGDATEDTDAVNLRQLNEMITNIPTGGGKNEGTFVHVNNGERYQEAGNSNTNFGSVGSRGGAVGDESIAIGKQAFSIGQEAISIGKAANTKSDRSIALGYQAAANRYNGMALGAETEVKVTNGIALGAFSIADREGFTTSKKGVYSNVDLKNLTYGALSVGGENGDGKKMLRQITNVGDATEATDAVNLRQLEAAVDEIATSGGGSGSGSAGYGYFHVNNGNEGQKPGNTDTNYGPSESMGGATGKYSLAAGMAAKAKGEFSVATGMGAEAIGDYSLAVGNTVESTGEKTLVIGNEITTDKADTKLKARGFHFVEDNWLDFTAKINEKDVSLRKIVAGGGFSSYAEKFLNMSWSEQIDCMSIDLKNSGKNERQVVMGNSVNTLGEAVLAFGNELSSMGDKSVLVGNTLTTIGKKSINIGTDNDIVLKSKVSGRGKSDEWYQSNFNELKLDINGRQRSLYILDYEKKHGQLSESEQEFANMSEEYIKDHSYIDLENELDFEGQISIGHSLETAGGRTINLGSSSSTLGEDSISLGNDLTTLGKHSINIGSHNNLQHTYGMILGNNSETWNGGIVIGNNSFIHAKTGMIDGFAPTGGIIIGDYAGSLGTRAGISIGYNARSVSSIDNGIKHSYQISPMNHGCVTYSTALALGNYSRAMNGIAIGTYAYAEVPRTVLADSYKGEKEVQAIAIGNAAIARKNGVVSIGGNAARDEILEEMGDKFGPIIESGGATWGNLEQTIQSENSIYFGTNSGGRMYNSLARRSGEAETERSSVYIGYSSGELSAGNTNIAVGEYANHRVTGSQNISIGVGARATDVVENVKFDANYQSEYGLRSFGERNIVLGNQILEDYSEVTEKFFENAEKHDKYTDDRIQGYDEDGNYVVLGREKRINDTISIGNITKATGSQSIALGSSRKKGVAGALAEGERSIAIGVSSDAEKAGAHAKGVDSVAFGTDSEVSKDAAVAMGAFSVADREAGSKENAFVLGKDRTTAYAKAVEATVKGKLGAFSVGNENATRQIINVAAGQEDTDAVNVSQLKQVANMPLSFAGDDKESVDKKLGDTLSITGKMAEKDGLSIVKQTTTGNIGVVKEGKDLEIRLSKNLKDLESVNVGKNGKNGVTITGIDGENGTEGQIGLSGANGKDGKQVEAIITVVEGKAGLNGTDGITRIKYKDEDGNGHEVATLDDGLSFGADKGTPVHKLLNSQLDIIGDGTIVTSVTDKGKIQVALGDHIILGKPGEDGEDGKPGIPGTNGSIGVNGEDGSSVVISGENGISITGPKGEDGKNGISADINIAIGQPGVDGTDGITRIIYEDKDGNGHEVATLGDGLKFKGDDKQVIAKKLNTQMDIVGGAEKLTDKNIGVVSEAIENEAGEVVDHKLVVKLAQNIDLGDKGSITTGNTVINNNGLTINNAGPDGKGTISITNNSVDMAGNKITNVAAGKDKTDVVNVSQLEEAISNINISGGGRKLTSKDKSVTIDGTTDPRAYDLSVKADGSISGGETGAVSGDTVFNYLNDNHYNQTTINKMFADQEIAYRANSAGTKERVKLSDGFNFISDKYLAASVDKDGEVKYGLSKYTIDIIENITNSGGDIVLPKEYLTYKANGKNEKVVSLEDGLNFTNGNYSIASVEDNGIVKIDIDTEKAKADIINLIEENTVITDGADISFGGDENISVVTEENQVNLSLNPELTNISSITNGDTRISLGYDHTVNMGDSVITGVADGKISEDSTEAVNGSQLYAVDQKVNYFGDKINYLGEEIGTVGAMDAALAALHPMQYDPLQRNQVMAGVGSYRNKQAIAVGAAHYFNENIMMTAGVALGEGRRTYSTANLGLTWKLGSEEDRRDLPERYKKGPIGSIYLLQEEMEKVLQKNQRQEAQLHVQAVENHELKEEVQKQKIEILNLKAQQKAEMQEMQERLQRLERLLTK